MLVLANLLIALMSTEYEKFQVFSFIVLTNIKCMNLDHFKLYSGNCSRTTRRSQFYANRLMHPPLNVIVYPIGIITILLSGFSRECDFVNVILIYIREFPWKRIYFYMYVMVVVANQCITNC